MELWITDAAAGFPLEPGQYTWHASKDVMVVGLGDQSGLSERQEAFLEKAGVTGYEIRALGGLYIEYACRGGRRDYRQHIDEGALSALIDVIGYRRVVDFMVSRLTHHEGD